MPVGYDQLDGMNTEQDILDGATPEISNFITHQKFNQKYKNILIQEFLEEKIKSIKPTDNINERVQAWLQQKLQSKIRQQIMRSITNFMRYLEKNEAIKIRVLKNQLDFLCSIDINNTIGYAQLGIMQINNLSQTMYKHFNEKKFNQDNIPHKIQLMFQKLYDCLKFLMYRSFDGENKPIDEIDFLIFSQKYLKQKHDKLERKFNFRQDGIVIGGLFTCCYRFFRVLFEFFLSYEQLFLIPDILKRTKQFCQKEEKFIQRVQRYIRLKLHEIRDFYSTNQKAIDLEQEIKNQMDGFQYQKLYQHFIKNASTSTKKLYASKQSISLYRWQKIISEVQNLQKIETSFDQRFSSQPTQCSFLVKGLIALDKDKLQIQKLFNNHGFTNRFKIHKNKFYEHQFIYATNQHDKVQIEKSGHFIIISKTQKQLKDAINFIKNTYKRGSVEIIQQSYILKGHLGLFNLKLKQIVPAPCFVGKIDINTKERQKYVSNRRQRLSATQINESQQQQIHSLVYKFKKPVWDQYNYKKQLMKMYILKNGTVFITNVKDRDFAKDRFKKVQEDIEKYLDRAIIKQNQEKKIKQQLDQLMDITVLCYPDQTKLEQGTLKQKQYFQNQLSYRKTKTIQQKLFLKNQIIKSLKTLKVLTWNILGYRQYWSIKNKKQQLKKTTDQNQKNKLIKQIKQIYQEQKKRFIQMVNVIKQHDPDIVCLQEAYFLYSFKQLFQQLLTTNLNGVNYHYAEYNKDRRDFPPVKDGKQGRNERTMILCKFPVKFSNLRSQYQNYSYDPNKENSHRYSFKLSIIADFQIVLGMQKQLSVLISSVHLKSGNEYQDNKIREFQFNYLNHLSKKYDISIFAGDFNSYDKPHITQQSQLSTISQFIRNNGYIDFEKYLISKHPTYRHIFHGTSILDKILIKFKDQKIQSKLKVKDIKFPGSFTMQKYEGQSWNITYKDKNPRALSDHIGLFAQFGFSK